ncbi:1-(5-phosphoribosyl)-5-amino-4-imidazole-carboxylate carboxylase [Actinomadura spongiicola]|uniref:1-(5-phosphoribosyl)-5-amino-4-imidazole-carboxylate carboxylase n=1 Tax=Actinomadura spongiicola TaxID=2303421 RepID=A0A372GP82_9ACTN|nr:AIR carboxylase family protein [Actinomadura spongiicola]RFS87191.1 1-(5-phosphoribosyl)-5-amino-4-imidazole-carboxylate carboxylase [Actinomadura spongiicola]
MTGEAVEELGFARVDIGRGRRRGHPEAVYCEGKTVAEVVAIAESLIGSGATNVLATRANRETRDALRSAFPGTVVHERARLVVLAPVAGPGVGRVDVVCGRPEDEAVAEEAALVAEAMGSRVVRRYDAPVHDPAVLPGWLREQDAPGVFVVADGTGGALPTLVSGLTDRMVIALPTSAGGELPGRAALLSALNSCSPGVVVVNIDNGYGAGYAAHLINGGGG